MKHSLLLLALITSLIAHDTTTTVTEPIQLDNLYQTPLGFGAVGGFTAGPGFSIRKHFKNRIGIGTSFFVVGFKSDSYYDENEKQVWIWGNFGIQGMYSFVMNDRKSFRFYGHLGANLYFDGDNYTYNYDSDSYYYDNRTYHDDISYDFTKIFGAGVGIEIGRKKVTFNCEIPFTVWLWDNGDMQMHPVVNVGVTVYPNRTWSGKTPSANNP